MDILHITFHTGSLHISHRYGAHFANSISHISLWQLYSRRVFVWDWGVHFAYHISHWGAHFTPVFSTFFNLHFTIHFTIWQLYGRRVLGLMGCTFCMPYFTLGCTFHASIAHIFHTFHYTFHNDSCKALGCWCGTDGVYTTRSQLAAPLLLLLHSAHASEDRSPPPQVLCRENEPKEHKPPRKKARKSSEDTQAAGYARFENFWANKFGSKSFWVK